MERFVKRHEGRIEGIITGFDRMMFQGTLRSISYVGGMEKFLSSQGVLYKDFGKYVEEISTRLRGEAEKIAVKAGRRWEYVNSSQVSKEEIAKQIMERDKVEEGLICVLRCVEPCWSYGVRKDSKTQRLRLEWRQRQCLQFYFYYLDREFGFMHVRLQSWFPFRIQVYINGREYLSRQMDKAGIGYEKRENCFTQIEDFKRAQRLMEKLESRKWERVLKAMARRVNPLVKELGLRPYYWSLAQSEYATDIVFKDRASLSEIYPNLVKHAIEQFGSRDVLRFLQRTINIRFQGEVKSSLKQRVEGTRVKHWVENNSIKIYDKQGSVLRVETTINDPRRLKALHEVRRNGRKVLRWVRMRKGVSDLSRRVEVSRSANERYLEALSVVGETTPSSKLLDSVSKRLERNGRPYRALHPVSAEDARLFESVLRGEFLLQGFRNKDIRPFFDSNGGDLSACIGRRLGLLRAHGLIFKVPKTHYYRITKKGQEVMTTAIKFRRSDIALLAA
jgi:hypothetical protein